ncbi:MAG: hypothetical protein ACPGVB_03480 [Chitinophagales bacterium]
MNKESTYKLLLKSLDEPLTDAEQLQLEKALTESTKLKEEKENLLKMRAMLSNQQTAYHFNPYFEGQVMAKIRAEKAPSKKASQTDIDFITALFFSFQRLAVPSFALICVVLVYVYLTADTLTLQTVMGISDISPEDLMLLNI